MPQASDRPLELEVKHAGSAVVICAHGVAGMNDAESMQTVIEDLADKQTTIIILDMSDLDFICSAGLGAIITGYLRLRHCGGDIRLVNPNSSIQHLLETTRLTRLFSVFSTVDIALAQSTQP